MERMQIGHMAFADRARCKRTRLINKPKASFATSLGLSTRQANRKKTGLCRLLSGPLSAHAALLSLCFSMWICVRWSCRVWRFVSRFAFSRSLTFALPPFNAKMRSNSAATCNGPRDTMLHFVGVLRAPLANTTAFFFFFHRRSGNSAPNAHIVQDCNNRKL